MAYETDPTRLLDNPIQESKQKHVRDRGIQGSSDIDIFDGVSDDLKTWFHFLKVHTELGYSQEQIVAKWERRPNFVKQ
jgi:hypothetical protein